MARRFSNKLVAKQVQAITKPGRHSDGNELDLLVKPNGNRSWVVILIGWDQRREMGLGSPSSVSLAEARKRAAEARAIVAEGRDPIAERALARPKPPEPVAVALPDRKQRKSKRHHAAMDYVDLPAFYRKLKRRPAMAARAGVHDPDRGTDRRDHRHDLGRFRFR